MKAVDYRGALRLLILYVLRNGPRHGYEIMKELELLFGKAPGPGALYPQLRYLRQRGLVDVEESYRGSKKIKIYKLTEAGNAYLEEHKEELDRILRHIRGAKALLDLGLSRVGEDLGKVIDLFPELSEEDQLRLKEILNRFAKELEEIISKYS